MPGGPATYGATMDRDRLRTVAGIALAVFVVVVFGLSRIGGLGGLGDAPAATCEDPLAADATSLRAGQVTAVTGVVARVSYEPEVGGAPTFVNLGESYPHPDRFDVVVYEDVTDRFGVGPDPAWEGRELCVRGQLRERDGVLQIVLSDPAEIELR
jgi:hypothetical protein